MVRWRGAEHQRREQEQLRCRASYDVAGAGEQLRLNLRCASASYNFDLASDVEYRGGAIRGSWTEASRNASGTLSGRAAGDHVEAAARGDSFSANLSLTTRGGRQTVSIRPEGTSITSVSLGAKSALVPLHRDYDWVEPGIKGSAGRCFGSTSSSTLRAARLPFELNPSRLSVNTIGVTT